MQVSVGTVGTVGTDGTVGTFGTVGTVGTAGTVGTVGTVGNFYLAGAKNLNIIAVFGIKSCLNRDSRDF